MKLEKIKCPNCKNHDKTNKYIHARSWVGYCSSCNHEWTIETIPTKGIKDYAKIYPDLYF